MTNFKKRRDAIRERLKKATPWKGDDKEPASEEWVKNLEANADLCRHSYADLQALLEVIKLQDSTLAHIHGLLSEDYFENWEECLEDIENLNEDIENILKEGSK